mgnify:CR=1 FL=1
MSAPSHPRALGCGALVGFVLLATLCGGIAVAVLDVPLGVAGSVGLGVAGLLLSVGSNVLALRRRGATHAALGVDTRRPLVLLRPFGRDDEDVGGRPGWAGRLVAANLRPYGARVGRLAFDDYLAPALTARLGPVASLQNARRTHFTTHVADLGVDDEVWRVAVIGLLRDAACVLVFPGGTGGLAWELGQLRRLCDPCLVLIVCRPDAGDAVAWPAFVGECRSVGIDAPDDAPAPGEMLCVDAGWRVRVAAAGLLEPDDYARAVEDHVRARSDAAVPAVRAVEGGSRAEAEACARAGRFDAALRIAARHRARQALGFARSGGREAVDDWPEALVRGLARDARSDALGAAWRDSRDDPALSAAVAPWMVELGPDLGMERCVARTLIDPDEGLPRKVVAIKVVGKARHVALVEVVCHLALDDGAPEKLRLRCFTCLGRLATDPAMRALGVLLRRGAPELFVGALGGMTMAATPVAEAEVAAVLATLDPADDRGPWLERSVDLMRRTRHLEVEPLARSLVLVDGEGALAMALGQTMAPGGLAGLTAHLRDAAQRVSRASVAILLATLGDARVAPALRELAACDDLPAATREAIARLISDIDHRGAGAGAELCEGAAAAEVRR